jgi:hypothetical protein
MTKSLPEYFHFLILLFIFSSNFPPNVVTAMSVDHPPVGEVDTEPSPNLLSVSATVPALPTQILSVGSPGPEYETPPTVSIVLRSRLSSLTTVHYFNLSDVSPHRQFNVSLPKCSQCIHATCEDYCG